MNILVTGANGQLGNEMRLVSRDSADNYVFTDVNQVEGQTTIYLDITDLDAIQQMVDEQDIQVIVNCAAYTNVDAAESNQPLAEKLNAEAPRNLAIAMKRVGGLLVHISTDYVFGAEPYNTPCAEDQQGTPTGVYGLTKLHGEQNILSTGVNHVIIRTAWLYSEYGKNFCKTMLNLTATKPALKVVFDQAGTPTYAWDLARAIAKVLEDYEAEANTMYCKGDYNVLYSKNGIYHFSNEGVCSWYDFTQMIQRIDNEIRRSKGEPETTCDVQPCHSNEFPSPVHRPAYSVLDKSKIKLTFGLEIPYWVDSLRTCIKNLV